ncbi:MAG: ABC transporter substrate-binding protein [Anaerolineae bacterium]
MTKEAEDKFEGKIGRRDFLRLAGITTAGVILSACGPGTPTATEEPAEEPAEEEPAEEPAEEEPTAEPTEAPPAEVGREDTLIIGFEGEPVQAPEAANPYTPGSRINQGYHQAMIESLWYLNYQTGEPIPWLAAVPMSELEWNEDYSQVDIPIREGVEWNDGEPFTADDVAWTLNMLKENTTLSYGAAMEQWLENAEAIDELTCRLTLTESNPRFLYNNFTVRIWGAVRILPRHIWEGKDPMTFTNFDLDQGWPVFTGPYRLVQAGASEFVYERRDDWWAAKTGFNELPAPRRLIFIEAGQDERKAAMLSENEVDGEPSLQIDTFLDVKERNPAAIGWTADPPHAWIDPCPGMVGFNCRREPWNDPDMRWAVAYAINHEEWATTAGRGYGIPAQYNFPMYPGLMSWLEENQDLLDQYDVTVYDPDRAKELIESKGYEMGSDGFYQMDGETLSVDILVKSQAEVAPALITKYLTDVGIDAAPQSLAHAQYYDRRSRGQFDIETTHVACGSVAEPYAELDNLHSRWIVPEGDIHSNNVWGYNNPEYDAIVDEMASIPPGEERQHELFRQALEIRLRDIPIIPISQQQRVVPYSEEYWTNWPTEDNDYFHPPNWWMCFLIPLVNVQKA